MAFVPRTWQTILAQIVAQINTLIPSLTSTSKAAYWRVWAFIQSVSQNLMEQRFQVLQTEIESTVLSAAPETELWIQKQVLNFQYGNTIQINSDFSISYPDPQLTTLITNCAVKGNGSGGVTIKVTPILSGPQSSALISYLQTILGADINFTIINALPDDLSIFGTVYYNGQYSGSIVQNVTDSVNNYITALGFNGTIKVSDLIEVIRMSSGVTDFVPSNIYAAPNGGTSVYLVQSQLIQGREYVTNSGQIQINGTNPLSTSLTYAISNN